MFLQDFTQDLLMMLELGKMSFSAMFESENLDRPGPDPEKLNSPGPGPDPEKLNSPGPGPKILGPDGL
ncbi:unnamed protein product [Rotaria sordida]|uniref:Uncharacterized protein n=1 Tax=Rotaria sordida TaxID=392033 RepID=A0A813Y7G5_9BILA|nr:unnamed protein product [Rotaria sordida]CAF1438512.1 unnamed protein product [Rotaria sordida]